jgi:hypothetical protein
MRNRHQLQKYDFSTPKARREAWTKILQADNYTQANGTLKHDGTEDTPSSYCCLGVACDIYQRVTGEGEWDSEFFQVEGELGEGTMPGTVARWYGLGDEDNPAVTVADIRADTEFGFYADAVLADEDEITASEANDDYGLSFRQIGQAFARRFAREDQA